MTLTYKKINIDDTLILIIILALSFGFTVLEEVLSSYIGFSSLLGVISLCIFIRFKIPEVAKRLMLSCNKIWIVAEMFLFVLVGACIKIDYATEYFAMALLLILISLAFRSIAVRISLIGTHFSIKEKSFTIFSYLPKATVQAAVGGGLLDLGNSLVKSGSPNGERIVAVGIIVLSVSVVAILITAPIGAILMNSTYKIMLKKDE